MGVLVSVHRATKSFAARPLFSEVTFSVESGERVGLIGPNGAGKSTLLKMIARQESADEGNVSIQRGLKVGFLQQVPTFKPGLTIESAVMEGADEGWEGEALAHEQIARLALDQAGLTPETLVEKLSGGWKKRVAFARELSRQPDLLLLDEPTNHLDVESILWLEDLISSAQFATVTITHDRAFLQKVASRILELDRRNPGGLLSVRGGYAEYLTAKEQLLATQERQETTLKNTLRRETEWLRQGAKARTTKQQARISRAEDLIETVSELETRNQFRTARLDFQSTERSPKKLLEARKITKRYGDRTLFRDLDLILTPGTRLGLLGANGSGKSTLIRVLLGDETPDSGEIKRADLLEVAYFQQNRDALDPTKTVLRTVCPTGDHVNYRGNSVHVRGYLDRFLFGAGQAEMAVGKLSGGEQARLLIALLMLRPANLLVLDEPTNDLDIATLGVLEEVLTDFNGAVILVSHDRWFLDRVSTRLIGMDEEGQGKLTDFADLDQWTTWRRAREEEKKRSLRAAEKKATADRAAAAAKASGAPVPKRKLSFKEQRELEQMETNIAQLETELARHAADSQKPEIASNAVRLREITDAMSKAQSELDRLFARWSELEG